MRSALSITLVLIAAMSGHSASACESGAQHPLRLLIGGYSQSFDNACVQDFSLSSDLPTTFAADLRISAPTHCCSDLTTEPASRSYETAVVASAPVHGP